MKQNFQKWLCLATVFMFIGCGGGEVKKNSESTAISLEKNLQKIGTLVHKVDLPPEPSAPDHSIEGVDTNRNGARDDLEYITYQGLNSLDDITTSEYEKVLSVIKMIQPKNPPVANSINEHRIYCKYMELPKKIRDEMPLSFLYDIVLNTSERRTAFNASLQPSTVSSGAEICE